MGSLMRRPTIMDIAKAAGVSKGAVSYALNGRPGVSESTRERILTIANDLGWAPSNPARALAPGGRVGAIGMVVDRPARSLGIEPFFMQLVSGVETELSDCGIDLMLQVAEDVDAELAVYRRWAAERRVDGVIMVDLRVSDPRPEAMGVLPLPAVVLGGPEGAGGLPLLSEAMASLECRVERAVPVDLPQLQDVEELRPRRGRLPRGGLEERVVGHVHHAGGVLGPLHVAAGPEEVLGEACQHQELSRAAPAPSSASTQVSLEPPPCEELTTSDPLQSATRVRPPGTTSTFSPLIANGRRSMWRPSMPSSTTVGWRDSATTSWAM